MERIPLKILLLFTLFQIYFCQPSNILISSSEQQQSSRNDYDHLNQLHPKCEPIQIPLCQEMKMYNMTIFPNLVGQTKQEEGSCAIFKHNLQFLYINIILSRSGSSPIYTFNQDQLLTRFEALPLLSIRTIMYNS